MTAQAEPVALIGAGAIGMSLGAALARAGHPITVCGGTPIEAFEVTQDDRTEVVPVTHVSEPAEIKEHRFAVLAVKAHQTDSAGAWIEACADLGTVLVVAQNGIEHAQRVAPYRGPSSVVPAGVYINAERTRAGAVTVRQKAQDAELVIPDDAAALRVKERFEAGGLRVRTESDFLTVAWLKLLINLPLNPLTALTLRRTEVLREPGIGVFALRLLEEACIVARAEGARIATDQPGRTLAYMQGFPEGATTSMLQDRLAGRALEHDAITGAVLRAAERHDLEVPHTASLHALVAALRP